MSEEIIPAINTPFKTKWKPDSEFLSLCQETLVTSAFMGYYDSHQNLHEFIKGLSLDSVYYFWNSYPLSRGSILDFYIDGNDRVRGSAKCNRKDFLSAVLDRIPVDFDNKNNHLRAKITQIIKEDFDYLSELTNARISNVEYLSMLWERCGLISSKDPIFFESCYRMVKREVGSVDKKLHILRRMFEAEAISRPLITIVAKNGTKKLKRTAVQQLCSKIDDYSYKLKYNRSRDILSEEWKRKASCLEELALLYASTDDREVIAYLAGSVSCDNLPWIMPSAARFPYILRDMQRRIDNHE
jgi:DNA-binding winged helix-turn-helix (wHTH) protein